MHRNEDGQIGAMQAYADVAGQPRRAVDDDTAIPPPEALNNPRYVGECRCSCPLERLPARQYTNGTHRFDGVQGIDAAGEHLVKGRPTCRPHG